MKNLRLFTLCVCLFLGNLTLSAQVNELLAPAPDLNKPKLFNNLPEKIKVDINELAAFINQRTGTTTSVLAGESQQLKFEGNVLFSVNDEQSHLKSVMLNLSLFPGARFTLTQLTNADGSTEYAGRILSYQHGDAYLLEKEGTVYFLVKKGFYDLVNN